MKELVLFRETVNFGREVVRQWPAEGQVVQMPLSDAGGAALAAWLAEILLDDEGRTPGIGSEFGGRHELYEINYGGSTEEIRRYCLFGAQASGNADKFKGFAEECMAEYDLDGWKVPDLTDPGELSYHVMRGGR